MTTINTAYLPLTFLDQSGNLSSTANVENAQKISSEVEARLAEMPPVEREAFLMLLNSSTVLAPDGGPYTAQQISDALDRVEIAATALTGLSLLTGYSDAIDLIARVMIEQAADQRASALADRIASRQQAQTELIDQAQKMNDAAKKIIDSAIVSLVLSVVAAAITIGFSIAAMKASTTAFKGSKELGGAEEAGTLTAGQKILSEADIAKANTLATFRLNVGKALGDLVNAAAGATSSLGQADSKNSEAEGSRAAARAEQAKNEADIKKELQDAVNQLLQAIINFIKEVKEAEVAMMQAITKG